MTVNMAYVYNELVNLKDKLQIENKNISNIQETANSFAQFNAQPNNL